MSSLYKGLVPVFAKNEEIYGIVPYQKFSCHVTLLLKRKLQHVGHMWVISRCSVGQWVKWVNRYGHFHPDTYCIVRNVGGRKQWQITLKTRATLAISHPSKIRKQYWRKNLVNELASITKQTHVIIRLTCMHV